MVAMGSCGTDGGGASELECRQIAELLGEYLDGTLPSHVRELLEFHIDGCAPCVAFVNTYRGTIAATRTLPDAPMPIELKKRLLRVLKEQRSELPPR
jgi:anti-sigma factor RsiW